MASEAEWPALPLSAWRDTQGTLHMYAQIVGKVRLAFAPMEPQWAQVPFHLTTRGLTTTPTPCGERTFSIDFDLLGHGLVIAVSDGTLHALPLRPLSVADFHAELMAALRSIGIDPRIDPMPVEVPGPIPFPENFADASYDPVAVTRFFHALERIDTVMKEHRACFGGRTSQVGFYWGTFDLAYSRYSGRPAEPPPGSGTILRFAMNAETIEAGFWPGDSRFPEPAFFSFTYPKPRGIESAAVRPFGAFWSPELGEHLIRYEDIRRAASPRAALLEFLETTYDAGATLAGWDRAVPEPALRRAA